MKNRNVKFTQVQIGNAASSEGLLFTTTPQITFKRSISKLNAQRGNLQHQESAGRVEGLDFLA